jgi:hypothetical protein
MMKFPSKLALVYLLTAVTLFGFRIPKVFKRQDYFWTSLIFISKNIINTRTGTYFMQYWENQITACDFIFPSKAGWRTGFSSVPRAFHTVCQMLFVVTTLYSVLKCLPSRLMKSKYLEVPNIRSLASLCLILSSVGNGSGLYNETYGATAAAWELRSNMPKF